MKCEKCGKEFENFRALNGHQSSLTHRSLKRDVRREI